MKKNLVEEENDIIEKYLDSFKDDINKLEDAVRCDTENVMELFKRLHEHSNIMDDIIDVIGKLKTFLYTSISIIFVILTILITILVK